MSTAGERWLPFASTQRIVVRRPGFVWNARIRMAPGVSAHVYDAYVAGEGMLAAKLAGLITVMEQPQTPKLAQGELMRFLAEAAWYPSALLPSQGVVWEAMEGARASATLSDGTTSAVLVFEFDARGTIRSVHSDGRNRLVDGAQIATAWTGRFWNYERRSGMLIPLEGEVAWLLPDGPQPYWRGRIQAIEYDYTARSVPSVQLAL